MARKPTKRVPITKEELEQLYFINGLFIDEIANKFNCSYTAIAAKFKKFGIQRDREREQQRLSKRISKAIRGRKLSQEHKDKISQSLIGHEISEETKAKISKANTGNTAWNKGLTKLKNPNKITYGVSGEDHWYWKGGISSERNKFRNSPEYKEWRSSVFARDNWTCQECGKRDGSLNAHHIVAVSESFDQALDIDNGITLCRNCHRIEHKKGKK